MLTFVQRTPAALALRRRTFRLLLWLHPSARAVRTRAQATRDHLLHIEEAAEEHYRKMARDAPGPLKEVFNRLADEEQEHHVALEKALDAGFVPNVGMSGGFTAGPRHGTADIDWFGHLRIAILARTKRTAIAWKITCVDGGTGNRNPALT